MPDGDRRAPDASEATGSLCLSNRLPRAIASRPFAAARFSVRTRANTTIATESSHALQSSLRATVEIAKTGCDLWVMD